MKSQWKRITTQVADLKPEDCVSVPVGALQWAQREIERLTHVNDDWIDWIDWSGGECPVALDTVVEYKRRDGAVYQGTAGGRIWKHYLDGYDIVRYRVKETA